MSKLYDPVPVVEKNLSTLRGVVIVGGGHGDTGSVKFMGKTVTAKVVGKAVATGASVTVVTLDGESFMLDSSGLYDSTFRHLLSEWGVKFKANLAIREILKNNNKEYLYRKALITGYDRTGKTATVGEPYNSSLPVKFGSTPSAVSFGAGLVCETDDANRHVVGYPSGSGKILLTGGHQP